MTERIYNEDGGWYCAKCGNFHDDYYDASVLKECPKCGENLIETEKMVDREYLLSVGAKHCDEKDYPRWLLNLREQHKKERERRKENVFCQKKKYEELERKARELEKTIDILVKRNTELKVELTGEIHKTTPLCKGCVNCIETGLGYFSCKLNRTCKDYIDCIEE